MEMGTIDPVNQARAVNDHEAVLNNGFAASTTYYEVGTAVVQMGIDNANRFKNEHDNLVSPAVEVCERGRELIIGENRAYRDGIDATQLFMHPDGTLGKIGKAKTIPLTERGFATLCARVTPGGAEYLGNCDPELRAYNLNKWFPVCRTPTRDEPKELAFWLRDTEKDPSKKEIFSVFGNRYVPYGGDKILQQIAEALPAMAKGKMKYDRYKGQLDVLFHSDVKGSDYVCGEYFQAGTTFKWADDGSGGIRVESFVLRNLCLNLIRLRKLKQTFISRRHTGSIDAIREDITNAIEVANQSINHFVEKWTAGYQENILEKYELEEPIEVFKGLVYNKVIWMPGVAPTEQVDRLMTAFEYETGTSKNHFVNAVTRCAHDYGFSSPWAADELEAVGGDLLYAKVWNVDMPEEVSLDG